MSGQGFKISKFALDETAEREGIWVDAGDGLRLLVARISSPAYEEHLRQHSRTTSTRFRPHVSFSAEEALEDAVMEGVAKHILLGWENLEEDDGTPIIYSWGKALEYFQKYREFYKLVLEFATEYDGYRVVQQEVDAKNLSAVSSGSSSGVSTPTPSESP